MQAQKGTYQNANEGLAPYNVPRNSVTMVTAAYYVSCPISLPSAFNNYIQQNTYLFVYALLQREYSECTESCSGMWVTFL